MEIFNNIILNNATVTADAAKTKLLEAANREFENAKDIYVQTLMVAETKLSKICKEIKGKDIDNGIQSLEPRKEEILTQIESINKLFADAEINPDNYTKNDLELLTEEINYWYAELYGDDFKTSIKVTGIIYDSENGCPIYADDAEMQLSYYIYPSNTILNLFAAYILQNLLDKMLKNATYPDEVEVSMLVNGKCIKSINFTNYDRMMSLI